MRGSVHVLCLSRGYVRIIRTVCVGAFSVWVEHNEMLDIADPAILV